MFSQWFIIINDNDKKKFIIVRETFKKKIRENCSWKSIYPIDAIEKFLFFYFINLMKHVRYSYVKFLHEKDKKLFNICIHIMNIFLHPDDRLNRVDSRCKENVSKSRFNLRGNMNFHDSFAKYFVYLGRTPRSRAVSSICKMLMYLRSSVWFLSWATSVSLRRDTRFPIE